MPPQPSLSSMPPEVKMMILILSPDVRSLRSLVHASPSYHAVYASSREQVFTAVTLQTLHRRNIRIFQPMRWALVYVKDPYMSFQRIKDAIESCVEQTLQKTPMIRLSIEHCQALLSVQASRRLWFYEEGFSTGVRSVADREEQNAFLALEKGDPGLKRGMVSVKGWPVPEWVLAQQRINKRTSTLFS